MDTAGEMSNLEGFSRPVIDEHVLYGALCGVFYGACQRGHQPVKALCQHLCIPPHGIQRAQRNLHLLQQM